jgi:C-terminal processing protease CtpA/Prc
MTPLEERMVRKELFTRRPMWRRGGALVAVALLGGVLASRSLQAHGAAAAMASDRGATQDVGAQAAGADLPAVAGRATAEVPALQAGVTGREGDADHRDPGEIGRHAREAAAQARATAEQAREAARLALRDLDLEDMAAQAREASRLAMQHVDLDEIRRQAREAAAEAHEAARLALRDIDVEGMAARARAAAAQWGGPPRLGLSVRDVTKEEAQAATLDAIAGAWVTAVADGSAAAEAGLLPGDVIVAVEGESIRSARHLTRAIAETPVGRALRITYVRNGQRAEVTATPAAPTPRDFTFAFPEGFPFEMRRPGAQALMQRGGRLGVSVQALTPQLASYFGVPEGVLVTEVREGTPAARAGIRAGDVITKVGDQVVARPGDVSRAVAAGEAGSTLQVHVSRHRQPLTLDVTLDTQPTRLRTPVRSRTRVVA